MTMNEATTARSAERADDVNDPVVAPDRSDDVTTVAASGRTADPWRRAVLVGMITYVISRMCVLAGAFVRASQVVIDQRADGEPEEGALDLVSGVLTSWDGRWYLEVVRLGYPDRIPPNITYEQTEARAAFFPLYPGAVRAFDFVLPGGDTLAALVLNFILGGVAVLLVGMLARRVFSVPVAARSMMLFAIFPGSFVLSFAYSEALFIVLAATCLLLLYDERWLLAGLAAALATASRPNGVAVVFACLVAAAIAIKTKRQWSSLVAVLLAPVGFIAFQLYVDATAGERGAWFRVQREAWAEGTSFGATAVQNTFGFLMSPFSSTADALTAASLMVLAVMAWAAWKRRLPLPWIAFSVVVVALMLIPETVTARPRFVFTAFPLFIAVAAWWPQPSARSPRSTPDGQSGGDPAPPVEDFDDSLSWQRQSWNFTLILCGAGLAVLTNLYGVLGAIP